MNTKKFGAVLLAGCLLCVGTLAIPEQNVSLVASASSWVEEGSDGLKYIVYDDKDYAVVSGATEEKLYVLIPDTFQASDGRVLPVTEITEDFFFTKRTVESAHLGENMKVVGKQAFDACHSLTSVDFNEGLETIGNYAFRGTALETLTLPDSVETIGMLAFNNCKNLTSVHLGAGVKTIGQEAFRGCSALKTIEFNEGLETINWAFPDCTALETVTLPSTLSTLTGSSFNDCDNLKTVNFLGGNDLVIGTAFMNCSALETVTMGEGIIKIADSAFSGGVNLKNVQLSPTLKTIGSYAFSRCSGLTEIELPASLETLGHSAFSLCSNLETVTFLGKETEINKYASIPKTTVIRGYEGSTAQAYAEANGNTFELIDSEQETPSEEPAEFTPGDVNDDGKVDILDVITINRSVVGKERLSDTQKKAADVNHSGNPDPGDSLMIMRFIVNLIDSLTE